MGEVKGRLVFENLITEDEYSKAAASQKQFFYEIAEKIERGKPLDQAFEKEWAAGALRAFADGIPLSKPKERRRAFTESHRTAYATYIEEGLESNEAIKKVSEEHGVHIDTVKTGLGYKARGKTERESELANSQERKTEQRLEEVRRFFKDSSK